MSNIKTELQYRIALGILGQMCSAGLVNDQEAETIRWAWPQGRNHRARKLVRGL